MTLKNIDKEIDLMETPVAVLKAEGEGEVVFFTQSGMVKRSTLSDLVIAKGFYQAMRVADGDKVISVQLEVKGKTFVMFSKNGYVVNFEKSEVPVQGLCKTIERTSNSNQRKISQRCEIHQL